MRVTGPDPSRQSMDWMEKVAKEISASAGSEHEVLALCAVAAIAVGGGREMIEELAEEVEALGRWTVRVSFH